MPSVDHLPLYGYPKKRRYDIAPSDLGHDRTNRSTFGRAMAELEGSPPSTPPVAPSRPDPTYQLHPKDRPATPAESQDGKVPSPHSRAPSPDSRLYALAGVRRIVTPPPKVCEDREILERIKGTYDSRVPQPDRTRQPRPKDRPPTPAESQDSEVSSPHSRAPSPDSRLYALAGVRRIITPPPKVCEDRENSTRIKDTYNSKVLQSGRIRQPHPKDRPPTPAESQDGGAPSPCARAPYLEVATYDSVGGRTVTLSPETPQSDQTRQLRDKDRPPTPAESQDGEVSSPHSRAPSPDSRFYAFVSVRRVITPPPTSGKKSSAI